MTTSKDVFRKCIVECRADLTTVAMVFDNKISIQGKGDIVLLALK